MKKTFTLLLTLAIATISLAQTVYLKGVLQGSQEVPATATGAGGVIILKYNMAAKILELWGNYRNLSSSIVGSHIHGSAPVGTNAGIVYQVANTGGTSGSLTATATLTNSQEADLIAGLMYVNVHSQNSPNGEIRAQITRVTQEKAVFLNARLQGAQEAVPNNSTAEGMGNVLIDTSTHTVWVSATYSGLSTPAADAHIHTGAPGVSGPVSVFVKFTPAISGSMDTSRVISIQNETDILNGNAYLNIHTSNFPNGEIRGQLLQSTTQRFFAGVLQGSQELPPVTTSARGTVIARYNTETNLFEFVGDYQNLSSIITASHVHGPAPVGSSANPIYNLINTGGTMGTLTLTRIITEDEEVQLLAGDWYANVHTSTNGGGEIRAQLIPLSNGETQYLTASLDVDEERLAFPTSTINSSGTGNAIAVLDKISNNLYLTGSYSNLSSGINNAHIHRGAAGVSGLVSINLQFVAGTTAGTITGSAINIRASLKDSIINGNSYVNIHTTINSTGEIRGQLGNLILPVKLTYFNGYADQRNVILKWTSAQESNLSRYEIEQQNDAGKWIFKGNVSATGSTRSASYTFNDLPLSTENGFVLYRLKMIDADSKFAYSTVVRLRTGKARAALMIMGNPVVKGNLNFMVTGNALESKVDVSVIDVNGKIVARSVGSSMTSNRIDVSNLAKGFYKLVIRVDDVQLQESFIK